jgi:hypothetical protein
VLPTTSCPAGFRLNLYALIKRGRDYVGLIIIENQLRREFRKPLGEGPEREKWRRGRPQLNKTTRFRGDTIINDESLIETTKYLNKQVAKAKRRDLCVLWSGTVTHGGTVFNHTCEILQPHEMPFVFGKPLRAVQRRGDNRPIVRGHKPFSDNIFFSLRNRVAASPVDIFGEHSNHGNPDGNYAPLMRINQNRIWTAKHWLRESGHFVFKVVHPPRVASFAAKVWLYRKDAALPNKFGCQAIRGVVIRSLKALMVLPTARWRKQPIEPIGPDMSVGTSGFFAKNAFSRLIPQMLWNFFCHPIRVLRGYGKYNNPFAICSCRNLGTGPFPSP